MLQLQTQRVVRSVLGHMAAQGIDRFDKGASTQTLRDYILDPALPMLPNTRFCYWLYPHRSRVLIRQAAIMQITENGQPSIIWIMKSFPLGFAVLWERSFRFELAQPRDFHRFTHYGIDEVAELPIGLARIPHESWPESPFENTMMMMGQEAFTANISTPTGRLLRKIPKRPYRARQK